MLSTTERVRKAIKKLADDVRDEILRRLQSPIGINRSVGRNTLIGSDLEKSIDLYVNDDSESITFAIADYFSFVAGGRKHGLTPRGQNVYGAIERWVKKNSIRLGNMTETQTIWAVLNKLKRTDLPARPFIEPDYDYSKDAGDILPFLTAFFEKWADDLFNELMQYTDEYFRK